MRKPLSRRSTLFAPVGLFVTRSASVSAQEQTAEPAFAEILRPLIEAKLQALSTPGVIVLVDVPGEGFWAEVFGVDDLGTGRPMSVRNYKRVGSLTKRSLPPPSCSLWIAD